MTEILYHEGEKVSIVEFDFDVKRGRGGKLQKNLKVMRIKKLSTKEKYLRRGFATKLLEELFEKYKPSTVILFASAFTTNDKHLSQRELEEFYLKFKTKKRKIILENNLQNEKNK